MITAYRSTSKWLAVLPVVAMLIFVVAPIANILKISLDFTSFAIITTPTTRNVVWFTTWQATISTVLVILFALPIAAITANFDFFGRRALISLISVPFILPTVVVAVAFL